MGSALTTFNDLQLSTGPAIFTGPDEAVNEAQKKSYALRRYLRGKDPSVTIQGGKTIRDQIMFDESNTFTYTLPQATQTWSNPQILDEWDIAWRYGLDHMSWTAQEVEHNITPGMTRTARFQQYKDLKRRKEARVWTSILNGMEAQMWAVPEVADMEASGGKQPYSIPAMINEQTDGLFYKSANVTGKTAWTTKQGIDPTAETRWVPQQKTYTSKDVTAGVSNLIAAFDTMFLAVSFESPGTKEEYFENDTLFRQWIAMSSNGVVAYMRLLRDYQDLFSTPSRQDPSYTRPQYAGIDVVRVSELDDALLYEAQTSTAPLVKEVESDANIANNGPRAYWLNANYENLVFHARRYFYTHEVKEHPNQHNTYIRPVDVWYNKTSRSLQRQGIVSPSGDVYDTADF